jgi:hypothetical protein
METGHLVHFASQKHPFWIEVTACLDLDCSCRIVTLKFLELVPSMAEPRDRLTFTLRVNLRTWMEQDRPPRSLEVESLVREFLVRFPPERIDELNHEFDQARTIERRLKSLSLSGTRDELVSYSNVIDEGGGVREGVTSHSFFFVFEGREFYVEDHYCAKPDCDCQSVHLEFWERVHEFHPKHHVNVCQLVMATFTLEGELTEVRYSQESDSTTKYLLLAFVRRCLVYFRECRRRYKLIKKVGERSFPPTPQPQIPAVIEKKFRPVKRTLRIDSKRQVRRNDPCPCGSGLKFKRCCARRDSITD